jgi:hypothetical protein
MKRKSFRIRAVMKMEEQLGRRWLREAQLNLRMAEDNVTEVRELIAGREPSEAEVSLLADSLRLVSEARDRVRFFDGVLSGMLLMERAVLLRGAVDDMPTDSPKP